MATTHRHKTPDIRSSRRDEIVTCSCGKTFRAIRYTCPCGVFGCRDQWQWVGIVDQAGEPETVWAEPERVELEEVVEDDATE